MTSLSDLFTAEFLSFVNSQPRTYDIPVIREGVVVGNIHMNNGTSSIAYFGDHPILDAGSHLRENNLLYPAPAIQSLPSANEPTTVSLDDSEDFCDLTVCSTSMESVSSEEVVDLTIDSSDPPTNYDSDDLILVSESIEHDVGGPYDIGPFVCEVESFTVRAIPAESPSHFVTLSSDEESSHE